MASIEWRDRAYEEAFGSALSALEARRDAGYPFTVEDAEGVLKHLYIREGNDDGSRGMLQDAVLAATIAAYAQFISAWKAEAAPREPGRLDRSDP